MFPPSCQIVSHPPCCEPADAASFMCLVAPFFCLRNLARCKQPLSASLVSRSSLSASGHSTNEGYKFRQLHQDISPPFARASQVDLPWLLNEGCEGWQLRHQRCEDLKNGEPRIDVAKEALPFHGPALRRYAVRGARSKAATQAGLTLQGRSKCITARCAMYLFHQSVC